MLGDMFLWLVANLKQGVIYFIKQALPPNKSAGSVPTKTLNSQERNAPTEKISTQCAIASYIYAKYFTK